MKESKHSLKVKGIDLTNQKLAERIGDLYYDSLADFLLYLSEKIKSDGEQDLKRGRVKLSDELFDAAEAIKQSAEYIDNAWDICKPYVKAWEEKHKTKRS